MVPRRASPLTLFAVLGVSFLARTCCAWRTYQSLIPNGDSVMRNGNAWPGVAHASERGGGVFNEFGTAFHAADKQWSVALCRADSDGDGFTNGEELGDPECVWTGGPASRQTDISHRFRRFTARGHRAGENDACCRRDHRGADDDGHNHYGAPADIDNCGAYNGNSHNRDQHHKYARAIRKQHHGAFVLSILRSLGHHVSGGVPALMRHCLFRHTAKRNEG
eukprot:CAMPEP_0174855756 /NCGR_PEP_ID=MMETSP1114-20130205/34145_1 /TAXON_ID=312471 /ORGANISM="Neobodo designis, Strain CCAP 1951/1" /LENGTH=220 /DNA_ID=CAMNT_0016090519 /DNA_START=21 /DNA_END=680 /DNA_ORIENTATION=+